ncbi:MAG TPA: roadblock/LC7 domain-containing protein, partial [Candidatus Acidoferrum sp.]|nr:roadblock/LC7 domain-containing protein [Candidatus Acidoferrum sp.]
IAFGELRQGSPPGAFYDNSTQDGSLVSLPLAQILASLDPALLVRKPGQKLVTVPVSVTSVFGQGRTLQGPVAGAPEAERPPAPASLGKPAAPQPGASHFTRPPVPGPLPTFAPKGSGPGRAGIPFPAPKPPGMPSAGPLVAEKEVLAVALSAVSESWPAPVLQAIGEFQLQSGTVFLPMSRLEAGLKAGRVEFTWGEVCHWLQPAPPDDFLANREVAVELPLKVVAPLFLARRRPGAARKMTGAANVSDHIPALFGRAAGGPGTAASATAAAGGGLGEVFGLPGRTEWTPPEICRRICGLEGVAGSLLAMSDGLAVAAQLPAGLNAETVAAFLPQLFGRVSQSAGEMQLGPVTSVALAAGQGRCAIYKAGKLYLAVLGHAGATLPEGMLGRIAAELAKSNP